MQRTQQEEEEYRLAHLRNERPVTEHGYCRDCRWWQSGMDLAGCTDINPRLQRIAGKNVGECHFGQPQLAPPSPDGKKTCLGVWPVTFGEDWCAQYQPHKGAGGLAGQMKF